MSKTTKLWLSPELELRHSISGWPVEPKDEGDQKLFYKHNIDVYQKALAKAKNESIPFENMKDLLDCLAEQYGAIKLMTLNPDSFIDYAGEVEVVFQQRRIFNGGWTDCSEEHYISQHRSFPKLFRNFARLKPVDMTVKDNYKDVSIMQSCPECGAIDSEDCKKENWGDGCSGVYHASQKPVQSNPVVIPDQSDYATEEEFFEACKERRKMMNGDVDAHEPDSIFTREDVRDMRERIKELEEQVKTLKSENKHMADLLAKYSENEQ